MAESAVKVEVADSIAMLTLDRPPVNALATQTYLEITRAFDSLKERPDVRVAVFTGGGERAFSAGADLKEAPWQGLVESWDRFRKIIEAFHAIYECPVPVIGAVNGVALGGGLALAACCDFLVASERAIFGATEIDVGRLGPAKLLERLVPPMKVRRMMYTGERIDAQEAYRLGMVEKVTPPDQLLAEARKLAEVICSKSPVAVRFSKRCMNEVEDMGFVEGMRRERWLATELRQYDDSVEGARAFVEKRAPVFKDE